MTPLGVIIFIMHVRNLRNWWYVNDKVTSTFAGRKWAFYFHIKFVLMGDSLKAGEDYKWHPGIFFFFFAILGRGPRAFHIGKLSVLNHFIEKIVIVQYIGIFVT